MKIEKKIITDLKKIFNDGFEKVGKLNEEYEELSKSLKYSVEYKEEGQKEIVLKQRNILIQMNEDFKITYVNFLNEINSFKKLDIEDMQKVNTILEFLKNNNFNIDDIRIQLESIKDNIYILNLIIDKAKEIKGMDKVKEILRIDYLREAKEYTEKVQKLNAEDVFQCSITDNVMVPINLEPTQILFDWNLEIIEKIIDEKLEIDYY